MPFIPALNVVKLVPKFLLPDGGTAVNTLHVWQPETVTPALLEQATTLYETWFAEHAAPLISNQVSLIEITATDLSVADGQQFVQSGSPIDAGSNSAAMLPAQVTFCTAFKSGYAGRSKRGRAYWIGLSETMVSGSIVAPTIRAAILDAWMAFGQEFSFEGWSHVVVSYTDLVETIPPTASFIDVTTYVNTQTRVATQRRRLPGVGS